MRRRELAQRCPSVLGRRGRGGLRHAFDRADEGHEVGLPHDLQLALRGALDRGLVERGERRAGIGLAQHAGMQQVVRQHVVHEGAAGELRRQVEARHELADEACRRRPSSAATAPVGFCVRSISPATVQ